MNAINIHSQKMAEALLSSHRQLSFHRTDAVDELTWPTEADAITLDSPASEIFTDFNQRHPSVVSSTCSACQARADMLRDHVRLKFVVDGSGHFVGVVSREDVAEQALMTKLTQGYANVDEILVTDLMCPREQLFAFDYGDLQQARVGDVVEILRENGRQHFLVVDPDQHQIRGIISASDIARKLRLPIDIEDRSSFVHVFNAIHG